MNDPRIDSDAVISRLRDEAAMHLRDAAHCCDLQESDRLTRTALALLDQARAAGGHRAENPASPDHERSLSPAPAAWSGAAASLQPQETQSRGDKEIPSMRVLIVLLLALLAAVLVPLIAHSEGLSRSGTCGIRWREDGARMALARLGDEVPSQGWRPSSSIRRSCP